MSSLVSVLVVDRDDLARKRVADLVLAAGAVPLCATSPKEALEFLRAGIRPSLAVFQEIDGLRDVDDVDVFLAGRAALGADVCVLLMSEGPAEGAPDAGVRRVDPSALASIIADLENGE